MKPQQTQDNEVERIREELDDIKETYANIVNQSCQDEREVHCSCVPALREEIARLRDENTALKTEVDLLKQGKVFVDPKWIYDLETQLAKAHEELCQAGLREYGN